MRTTAGRLALFAAPIWLGVGLAIGMAREVEAQPVSGSGVLEAYQRDVSCAAAADAWLFTMPGGSPSQDQDQALKLAGFFAEQSQTSGHVAGFLPEKIAGTIEAFKAWSLPGLSSPDPAKARTARDEVAAAARQCAAMPEFKAAAGEHTQTR